MPEQEVVVPWRLGRLALRLHQGRHQHVLHQTRLAGTGDPGDGDQPVQRKLHVDPFEIVLAGADEREAMPLVLFEPPRAPPDPFASEQIRRRS